MQKRNLNLFLIVFTAVLILSGFILVSDAVTAEAAAQPISITTCKLNTKGTKITVKAKVSKKTSAMGSKLYLLGLNANVSESGKKSASPLASVKAKKGKITFKVNYKSSMLFQKFVVAYKSGKKYNIASDVKYITNPQVLASFTGNGPTAASKKGLQVEEVDDSLELGTQHAVINWTLNSLLNNGAINKTSFTYKNKTYYLDADQLLKNDEVVRAYNAAGVRVTIILLLPKDTASTGTKDMQFGGYNYTLYSSIKTSTKAGCQEFEAVMSYLAKRYGTKENLVSGWILGNEVNSACIWNYGGNKSLSNYMKNYARAFRICYNAVKSVSKNSKVYISLDYNWNTDSDGSGKRYFSSKATLDAFYKQLKADGAISFQIAYHAYPEGMSDPIFWDDAKATSSVNSKIVNFKNLQVLTNYAKKNFGKDCTIMLSEQSFNSSKGEAIQAAAYAYAYYMCEGNSMIEAFIYGRHVDHPSEMSLGYNWGLYNNWYVKRLIWHVFQYIDSKESFTFTDPLLKFTNLKKWNKISGFKRTMCTKMASKLKKGNITSIESASATSLQLTWDKINTADGYEIYRDGSLLSSVSGNSIVTYTDKGLKTAGTYRYQIRMYKEAPKASDPTQKVKIYGTLSDAKTAIVTAAQVAWNEEKCGVSGNIISLAWKKMTDVTGFEVCRSTAQNGAYTVIATLTGDKTSYEDHTAVTGTTYYYKVRAYVTVGGTNYYGNYSEVKSQLALIQLTVSFEDGSVKLDWTEWPNMKNYRVFYKTLAEETYIRISQVKENSYVMSEYKDAAGTASAFIPGQTYCFRVRAVMQDGTLSKFSNVVEFTIPAQIPDQPGNITPEDPKPDQVTPADPQPEEVPGAATLKEPDQMPDDIEMPKDPQQTPDDIEASKTESGENTEMKPEEI